MNIVVSMIVKNEDDVIEETISEISKYTKNIIVLDGGSNDGTIEILKSFPFIDLHQVDSGDSWNHAGERELLLKLTREKRPDWVITLDADEIYHTNPLIAIEAAEKEQSTIICCEIPQFHFTEKELLDGTLQSESETLSVQERRKFYSWGWRDFMIFKMQEGLTYLGGKDGRITRPPYYNNSGQRKEASVRPILKHYQYRSLRQYAKKMKNRRQSCGKNHKRWFKWTYENPFFNESDLGYFDGRFFDKKGNLVG